LVSATVEGPRGADQNERAAASDSILDVLRESATFFGRNVEKCFVATFAEPGIDKVCQVSAGLPPIADEDQPVHGSSDLERVSNISDTLYLDAYTNTLDQPLLHVRLGPAEQDGDYRLARALVGQRLMALNQLRAPQRPHGAPPVKWWRR
jgi:hypothetical protein